MTAYLYKAPAGVPGSITRVDNTTVESAMFDATTPPTKFGQPVKVNPATGKMQLMGTGSAAADFYGINTRIVPAIGGDLDETLLGGAPDPKQFQGIAIKGYVNVLCPTGTPVRDGAVYVRVVLNGAKLPGDFEATADGVNNVLVPELVWATNGKDSSNVAEVRIAR